MSTVSVASALHALVASRFEQSTTVPAAFFEAEAARIAEACWAMARRFHQGGWLIAWGNGAWANDAQDLVADLLDPPQADWPPLPAMALLNDIAVVTAVGNDVGFDNVFARQVIAFGRPGDIAFGVSTSGNSTNVLVAIEQAKKQGLLTVGLAGYDGGKMAGLPALDYGISAPSANIPRIQTAE